MSVAELLASLRMNRDFMNNVVAWERLPARRSSIAPYDMDPRLASALESRGVSHLFTHQVDAVTAVEQNENVVIATATASGSPSAIQSPSFSG